MTNHLDVLIVGAGLSGLTAAFELTKVGKKVVLLEARDRLGGRIFSVPSPNGPAQFDLGPAWFWGHHGLVQQMMRDFGLEGFVQYETGHVMLERRRGALPERVTMNWPQPTSYRLVGGTIALVEALAQRLDSAVFHLNHVVQTIRLEQDTVYVTALANGQPTEWQAKQVIVTLPPHLAATSITYEPSLPPEIVSAMVHTPTWMGEAMKVSLVYERPFWRKNNLSGMAVSYAGPVQQFHDATPADESVGALFGWVGDNSSARLLTIAERKAAVIAQAVRLFGQEAANPLRYAELNWEREPFTTNPQATNRVKVQEHPQYGHPLLQDGVWNGRLWWATTETSPHEGGYLEGAIYIGKDVAQKIISHNH